MKAETAPDKVYIKKLVVPCKVGVFEEERQQPQNIVIDIEMACSLADAGNSDDLQKTVDYWEIKEQVTAFVAECEFKLLEPIAEHIAAVVLKNPSVTQVTVGIKKEKYAQQPVMGIEITRDRLG
ncbi:MAG: dihydroneopterin aldolase [Candidatus Bathyarchaeota archaeon]|nr:dihydroneopterin aldolase [Candidatus Bathyarchaeota archaeon]